MAEEENRQGLFWQASDRNDFSYSTGRARALESQIKEVEALPLEQIAKDYSLDGKELELQLEALMEKNLMEFSDPAPEAVRPFRLMADLSNMKAFIRKIKTGEEIPYSRIGTFEASANEAEMKARLRDSGYPELSEKLKELLRMRLRESDIVLENYFTSKIENRLFAKYLEMKKQYLKSEESPEEFYRRLKQFITENSMLKSMHPDVATSFLLLKQRELEIVRARIMAGKSGGKSDG